MVINGLSSFLSAGILAGNEESADFSNVDPLNFFDWAGMNAPDGIINSSEVTYITDALTDIVISQPEILVENQGIITNVNINILGYNNKKDYLNIANKFCFGRIISFLPPMEEDSTRLRMTEKCVEPG